MKKLHFLLAGAIAVSALGFSATQPVRADETLQTDEERNARTPAEIAQHPELGISYGNLRNVTDPEIIARLQQLENQVNEAQYNGYYGYPNGYTGYYGYGGNYPSYPQGYGYPYGYYNYGYNYPPQQPIYSGPIGPSPARGVIPPWATVIPLGNTYTYPTPPCPPGYGYPPGYGGGGYNNNYRQNNQGYRGSYRRGGVSVSVGSTRSSGSYATSTTTR